MNSMVSMTCTDPTGRSSSQERQLSFSSTLTNLRASRKLGSSAELTLDVFNLFDRKVNDIQYFYESQLPGEAASVNDRHVHPAEPRTARLSLLVRF